MSTPLPPDIARWKKYLRYDPTRWLLETNDPSILLGYQLDIANRPADAQAVVAAREHALYSGAVQAILRAQDELGFWGEAEHPAQPYYRGTIWNLVLLSELGIPPTSRRGRLGCEFVLQNFLDRDGAFLELNAVETGYMLRALAYFNLGDDPRVKRAAESYLGCITPEAENAGIMALWAMENIALASPIGRERQAMALAYALDELGRRRVLAPLTFPQFDPNDPLFILRVLTGTAAVDDARLMPLVEHIVSKQNDQAQWTLERDLNDQLETPLEQAGMPSRWLTLNALRVIVRIVRATMANDATR